MKSKDPKGLFYNKNVLIIKVSKGLFYLLGSEENL
jgi:hypothetical protein